MKSKKDQQTAVSEYMRIRRYVMNLLYRDSAKPTKIPSLNELSNQFQVSRPTVCKALKELIEEGFLIARPGLGTFANPEFLWKRTGSQPLPLIGIIFGNGLNVHYDFFIGQFVGELMAQLVRVPTIVHLINFSSSKIDTIKTNIQGEQLDGLCWYNPPPEYLPMIDELRQQGLVIVTGGRFDASDAQFDFDRLGYQCGQKLLADGRKNILFLDNQSPHSQSIQGLKRAFAEHGLELNQRLFLQPSDHVIAEVKRIFELGVKVDAIFNPYLPYPELKTALNELKIDLTKDCLLIQNSICLYRGEFPAGYLYDIPFAAYAERMIEKLQQQLTAGHQYTEPVKIEIPIRKI